MSLATRRSASARCRCWVTSAVRRLTPTIPPIASAASADSSTSRSARDWPATSSTPHDPDGPGMATASSAGASATIGASEATAGRSGSGLRASRASGSARRALGAPAGEGTTQDAAVGRHGDEAAGEGTGRCARHELVVDQLPRGDELGAESLRGARSRRDAGHDRRRRLTRPAASARRRPAGRGGGPRGRHRAPPADRSGPAIAAATPPRWPSRRGTAPGSSRIEPPAAADRKRWRSPRR